MEMGNLYDEANVVGKSTRGEGETERGREREKK